MSPATTRKARPQPVGAIPPERSSVQPIASGPMKPPAYPVAATVFVLMPKAAKDAGQARAALGFFRWALEKGQTLAADLHYVPLPAPVVSQVEGYWKAQFKVD